MLYEIFLPAAPLYTEPVTQDDGIDAEQAGRDQYHAGGSARQLEGILATGTVGSSHRLFAVAVAHLMGLVAGGRRVPGWRLLAVFVLGASG